MKNFSEATATKPQIKISLCIRPVGEPHTRIKICDNLIFDGIISSRLYLEHLHDLLMPLDFSIELRDKTYTLDQETAVIVDEILVDGISIVPEMSHYFRYENDHGFREPTCYLGFNGVWSLNTGVCFYRWWHEVTGQGWLLEPTS